jgi:hypothetical protein
VCYINRHENCLFQQFCSLFYFDAIQIVWLWKYCGTNIPEKKVKIIIGNTELTAVVKCIKQLSVVILCLRAKLLHHRVLQLM